MVKTAIPQPAEMSLMTVLVECCLILRIRIGPWRCTCVSENGGTASKAQGLRFLRRGIHRIPIDRYVMGWRVKTWSPFKFGERAGMMRGYGWKPCSYETKSCPMRAARVSGSAGHSKISVLFLRT